MEGSLLDKLIGEIGRYNNKAFLKAAMAVCALTATADDDVSLAEYYRIDEIIAKDPALKQFDPQKATDTLYEFVHAVRTYGESARQILYGKVRRMAGNHKKSRTLMRAAYLVIVADQEVRESEMREFHKLCGLLNLKPEDVWRELGE